jgi:uroporphyrin-3 C-methyltransferase
MSESDEAAQAARLTGPESPQQAERSQPPRASGNAATVLALIALGLSIGLAASAYFTWSQVQRLDSQQAGLGTQVDERLQPLRAVQQQVDRDIQAGRRQIDERLTQFDGQFTKLDQARIRMDQRLDVLAALVGRSDQGWSLAEVEYLLRIANQRLQLQGDLKTAQQALAAADGRLRELADPHFLSVREQIARDLAAIEAVPAVDIEGITVTLNSWLQAVDELPVAGTRYQPVMETPATAAEPGATVSNWRDLPRLLWSALTELFVLREHDKPVGPMLPPEREYFLRENLRLQLGAARLALLRDDAVQYRATLTTAQDWLEVYFAADSEKVRDLVTRLGELAAVDISPQLPDISASIRLLRQQLKLAEQQAVLPVVPATAVPEQMPDEQNGDEAP